MERDQVTAWVSRYERAWRTPGTDVLAELFTEDATYSLGPYREPVRGLPAIAIMWDAEREGPDEAFAMDSEVVAVDGDTGVVRVEVRYGRPSKEEFRDLWIMRFADDGRCRQFEEWPYAPQELTVEPVGRVSSPLRERADAPKQGDEGAPEAWLEFEPRVGEAMGDLRTGSEVLVLTWLDRAQRDVLKVYPRSDLTRPETGVFATRSPDRPNPIGLHRVEIIEIHGLRVRVRNLEAIDGTPIVDVKPLLGRIDER